MPFCLLALGSGGITGHGIPNASLTNCQAGSNGPEDCTGGNLGVTYSFAAAGDTNACASASSGDLTDPAPLSDALDAGRASNIPTASAANSGCASSVCSGGCPPGSAAAKYPQEGSSNFKASGNPFTLINQTIVYCGDFQMSGDQTWLAGDTLVVENGQFDTSGHTLNATSGSTIIFNNPTNAPANVSYMTNGSGTLNLVAPTSGTWSGIAIYQNPSIPIQSFIFAGNSPTWNINGLVYIPATDISFRGTPQDTAHTCFGVVADSIDIRGTGNIIAQNNCASVGATLPGTVIAPTDIVLVQ